MKDIYRNSVLHININEELYNKIKEESQKRCIPLSSFVKTVLYDWLKNQNN